MIQKENQKGKIRCFIAVEIPDEIKKKIEPVIKELIKVGTEEKTIRPVSLENMHITVKFLGYLTEEKLNKIKEKLREVEFASFSIEIKGIGVFPNERQARVLWVDCQSTALRNLAKAVNTVLEKEFPEEDFIQHLTIGRVKGKIEKEKIKEVLQKYKETEYGAFLCKEFVLKQSVLKRDGPVYMTREKYSSPTFSFS